MPWTVIADTIRSAFLIPLHVALLLAAGAAVAVLAWEAAVQSLCGLLALLPPLGVLGALGWLL